MKNSVQAFVCTAEPEHLDFSPFQEVMRSDSAGKYKAWIFDSLVDRWFLLLRLIKRPHSPHSASDFLNNTELLLPFMHVFLMHVYV